MSTSIIDGSARQRNSQRTATGLRGASDLLMPWRGVSLVLMSVLLVLAGGCPGEPDPGPECGPGTSLNAENVCIADSAPTGPSCGDGTTLVDGSCLGQPVDAGFLHCVEGGTVTEAGACVADAAVEPILSTCGEGTVETDGGLCVLSVTEVPTCEPPCAPGFICNDSLSCEVITRPATWSCSPGLYNEGESCDCNCGAVDPDCADSTLEVVGCYSQGCRDDGSCEPCLPQCDGRQCGDDSCGGSCGACLDSALPLCAAGQCVVCTPDCGERRCGDDGCGGTCGTCESGTYCQAGLCDVPPLEASCQYSCGFSAPSGCSCEAGCAALDTCCIDVEICGCLPDCFNKDCGDDGCGGFCGLCQIDETCDVQQHCVDA